MARQKLHDIAHAFLRMNVVINMELQTGDAHLETWIQQIQ